MRPKEFEASLSVDPPNLRVDEGFAELWDRRDRGKAMNMPADAVPGPYAAVRSASLSEIA
jgi:hypothetical protein